MLLKKQILDVVATGGICVSQTHLIYFNMLLLPRLHIFVHFYSQQHPCLHIICRSYERLFNLIDQESPPHFAGFQKAKMTFPTVFRTVSWPQTAFISQFAILYIVANEIKHYCEWFADILYKKSADL